MTGDLPDPALAALIVALMGVWGLVFAVVAWDMRRLPRLHAEQRVVAAAEQALVDADFHTLTEPLEQP